MGLSHDDNNTSLLARLSAHVQEIGFAQFGFAELTTPISIGLYEEWLAKGYQGEMTYLARHLEDKKNPVRLLKRARSAIVVTENYVPHPSSKDDWPLSNSTRVAAYARGVDYHHFLKEKLTRLIDKLKTEFPDDEFVSFTDSGPVLERDLAARAGLGWVGKNTCLIHRKEGSLFFIAEIYSSLTLPVAQIEIHDHCGTCTRCLDACPTGALKAPRELDARRCISYLTIESRENPPEELRASIGDWLFGCDICQTVCPWNIKAKGREALSSLEPSRDEQGRSELIQDLRFLLTSPNRALERAFQGTPLFRSGGVGLKRNALIVTGNLVLHELEDSVRALSEHPKLGELAQWALLQMQTRTQNQRQEP